MPDESLTSLLESFASKHSFASKGPLCVALVVTDHARTKGFPLIPKKLITKGKGQVLGLSKPAVQSILRKHGIIQVLAEEGGRTSRGSVGNMENYCDFLNRLDKQGLSDLEKIETWWIERVRSFFSAKPFLLKLDPAKSLRAIVKDLLVQAARRQQERQGTMFLGTMLQHLVGAKLDILLGPGKIKHHGASVSDQSTKRDADFFVEDVAIHVTSAPGEGVMRKCIENLAKGYRPLIITTIKGVGAAEVFADSAAISQRVDIFEAEQFIAGNVYELGRFESQGRKTTARQLTENYNSIVEKCETDPSLRIELIA